MRLTQTVTEMMHHFAGAGTPADRAEARALLAHLKKFRMPAATAGTRYAKTTRTRKTPTAKKGPSK